LTTTASPQTHQPAPNSAPATIIDSGWNRSMLQHARNAMTMLAQRQLQYRGTTAWVTNVLITVILLKQHHVGAGGIASHSLEGESALRSTRGALLPPRHAPARCPGVDLCCCSPVGVRRSGIGLSAGSRRAAGFSALLSPVATCKLAAPQPA
jgi:hypothetical protein